MEFAPAAYVFLPIAVAAAFRKRWALCLVFAAIPLYGLRLFHAVGHPFTATEISILSLGLAQAVDWGRTRQIEIPTAPPLYLFGGFLVVGVISIVYAYLNPADVLVRPYNVLGTSDVMRPYEWTTASITQFALRLFSLGAIALIAIAIRDEGIGSAIQAIVYGAVAVGAIGVLYQASILLGVTAIPEFLRWIGIERLRLSPSSLGPLPRMYSTVNEPGYVAHYLLTALALTATYSFSTHGNGLFSKRRAGVLSLVLLIMIGLSTGTTGYGGVGILGAVLLASALGLPSLSLRKVSVVGAAGVGVGAAGVASLSVAFGVDILSILSYQAQKLTFSAGSGAIRLRYIGQSMEILAARPLLGVGIGGWYGLSVAGTILGETGLVGFVLFVGAYLAIFYRLLRSSRDEVPTPERVQATALLIAGVTILTTTLLAKTITALRFPWFWMLTSVPIAMYWQPRVLSWSNSASEARSTSRPTGSGQFQK